jgi:hypothetical protein
MINQTTETRQLPPLGHLSVRAITKALMAGWSENVASPTRVDRGADLEDLRSELQRRERLGVGLRP